MRMPIGHKTLVSPVVAAVAAMLLGASSCGTSSGINNQPQASGSGNESTAAASASSLPAVVAHLGDSVVITGINNEKLSVQLVKVVDPASSSNQYSQATQGKHY